MDVLFLEHIEFKVDHDLVTRCRVAPSQEEGLRRMMEQVGIELIDYGSFTVRPALPERPYCQAVMDIVSAYSKAYRERAERAAAHR